MTPTLDSLLVACRRDPDADLPRLVVADWLDEHGQEARAELIRVQCELAGILTAEHAPKLLCGFDLDGGCRWPLYEHKAELCPAHALRRREQELLKRYASEWARPLGEAFEAYCWNGKGITVGRWQEELPDLKIPVSFVRGLLHVEAPLQTLREGLPRLGRELLWVGSVRCMDREPYEFTRAWAFIKADDDDDLSPPTPTNAIPTTVFDRLKHGELHVHGGPWRDYDSREAALADLDGWILEEAWTAAGLPWPTRETTPTGG